MKFLIEQVGEDFKFEIDLEGKGEEISKFFALAADAVINETEHGQELIQLAAVGFLVAQAVNEEDYHDLEEYEVQH